jgi:membrane-bound lytic murein transglycosylase D
MRYALIIMFILSSSAFASDFDEPECLKKNVEFWHDVYVKYDKDVGVVFNTENLDTIKIVALPEDESLRSDLVSEIKKQYEKKGLKVRVQKGISSEFDKGISRRMKYEDMILKELKNAGLPKEISALPHVESSYQADAVSKVGAVGLWQVMPASARLYGFKKNIKNPKINTKAGIAILLDNYRQLGSWPLAITAYNHGLAGVKRAVKETGSRNICSIIEDYDGPRFGVSSRNFYASFLAVIRILKEREVLR